jgi:prevent-host-death family protein
VVIYHDLMTRIVTATEAKARILALLDEVAAGEEVQITKRGRVVARLVPAVGPAALRGALAGVAATAATDDDLFTTGVAWDVA